MQATWYTYVSVLMFCWLCISVQWYLGYRVTLLTNFSANEDFYFAVFRTRLTNVLVDARANIKQQTWTVGPFLELKRSSINVGQIFDFSFRKETERGQLLKKRRLALNKLWKFGRRIVKTLCTYFQFNIYSPFFFSSKCSLFHNSNLFGSYFIHILYTGCVKI